MKAGFFQDNDEFSSDEEIKVKKSKKTDQPEEKVLTVKKDTKKPYKKGANKEEKKKAQSEMANRFGKFTEIATKMNNFIKILDYEKILEQYEEFEKECKKSHKLIEEYDHPDDYIRS